MKRLRLLILCWAVLPLSAEAITVGPEPVVSTPLARGTKFASPSGSGQACSVSDPCSIATAISVSAPGDVVFLRGGIYPVPSGQIIFSKSGTPSSPITYESYPGETAVLDGSGLANGVDASVRVTGNWNVLRRIEITRLPQNGLLVRGSNNVIDGIFAHHNRLGGVMVHDGAYSYPYSALASFNTLMNIVATDNSDAGLTGGNYGNGGNSDGIGVYSGEGNTVIHCLSLRNSDDGIDMWRSTNTHVSYSISGANGIASGNGNGFKGGSSQAPSTGNIIDHSIAYSNRSAGFDYNGGANVKFSYTTAWDNNVAYYTGSNNVLDHSIASSNSSMGSISGTVNNNSWQQSGTANFISTDPASGNFLRPTVGGGFEGIGAVLGNADTTPPPIVTGVRIQ